MKIYAALLAIAVGLVIAACSRANDMVEGPRYYKNEFVAKPTSPGFFRSLISPKPSNRPPAATSFPQEVHSDDISPVNAVVPAPKKRLRPVVAKEESRPSGPLAFFKGLMPAKTLQEELPAAEEEPRPARPKRLTPAKAPQQELSTPAGERYGGLFVFFKGLKQAKTPQQEFSIQEEEPRPSGPFAFFKGLKPAKAPQQELSTPEGEPKHGGLFVFFKGLKPAKSPQQELLATTHQPDTKATKTAGILPVSSTKPAIRKTGLGVPHATQAPPKLEPTPRPSPSQRPLLHQEHAAGGAKRPCWQQFCRWLTYRPLAVPPECGGYYSCPTSCEPPLYTYFLGSRYTGHTNNTWSDLESHGQE